MTDRGDLDDLALTALIHAEISDLRAMFDTMFYPGFGTLVMEPLCSDDFLDELLTEARQARR